MHNPRKNGWAPNGIRLISWRCSQEGRKTNGKSETEPESPKTEPIAVYKETGETRNRRNRNRGLQKVVPLHRPEVGQIESCRGLSTIIRKRSARSTKWTWFGLPRGLEEAAFLFFQFNVLNKLKQKAKKNKTITRISNSSVARIQNNWNTIIKKEDK